MHIVNTAILSYGMSGRLFHAPFFEVIPGFNFYAVWERSKNIASERHPDVKTYRTLEALLADDAVELVIVNTPNYSHYEYAKKALLAGKHVVVEKPFTGTVAEGEELIAIANERNCLLSVYQNRRYDSDFKAVKKVVEKNLLGKIAEAEFHFDRFKEDLSPKAHKETPGPGTGALYDLGSHIIDQALYLFGMPQEVFGDIRTVRPVSQVDDYFEVLLYYPDLRVRLHSSYLVREALPAYILHGSKGSFIKAKTDVQEAALDKGLKPEGAEWGKEPENEKGLLHTEINGKVSREFIASQQGDYSQYYRQLYKAITEKAALPVTGAEGLAVIRIIEAAFKSSNEKKVVPL